jgi:hypothetical protein
VNIPGFIARQFYVSGSLRNTPTGFQLEARNPMGDGTLVGVGRLRIDGSDIPAEAVSAQKAGADEPPMQASAVTSDQPVRVSKGDRVILRVEGDPLAPGEHKLEVELFELNLGRLRFSLSDTLAAD